MQFFCFIRFGNVKVQKKKKNALKKRSSPFSDKTNSNVMRIKNGFLFVEFRKFTHDFFMIYSIQSITKRLCIIGLR